VFLSGKEIKRIEHFIGQRISELINLSANGADRNEPMVSYARLGPNKAPTDVPPDGFEKCVSQLRGYWFVHGLTRRDARCLTCGPGYKRRYCRTFSGNRAVADYSPDYWDCWGYWDHLS
jgi:hypothetical protein